MTDLFTVGQARIDGGYRYWLRRAWSSGALVCWIMLNPSTADATTDDPTIRRCIGFTKAWGYGGLVVVNLFALRATDPKALRLPYNYSQSDYLGVVGPFNDEAIVEECDRAALVVAAWGNHGALYDRANDVLERIYPRPVHHLGLTKMNQPRHPLYVRADAQPKRLAA